jgi:hypothetical protein
MGQAFDFLISMPIDYLRKYRARPTVLYPIPLCLKLAKFWWWVSFRPSDHSFHPWKVMRETFPLKPALCLESVRPGYFSLGIPTAGNDHVEFETGPLRKF